MRLLPCHPPGDRPPFDARISLVLHLPRLGLQHDRCELGHARQRREEHHEHHWLERNVAKLFQLMPRHGKLGVRKHDTYTDADTDTYADTYAYDVRHLPHHPAGVWRALVPQEPRDMRHLPRHRLQHDRRELGHARQRCDKHREHPGLESVYSLLLELMPRLEELVGKK